MCPISSMLLCFVFVLNLQDLVKLTLMTVCTVIVSIMIVKPEHFVTCYVDGCCRTIHILRATSVRLVLTLWVPLCCSCSHLSCVWSVILTVIFWWIWRDLLRTLQIDSFDINNNSGSLTLRPFSTITWMSRLPNNQPFWIYAWPQEVLLSFPPWSCPRVHRLACQQSLLQEWHTEAEQIIINLSPDFTLYTLPVAAVPINPVWDWYQSILIIYPSGLVIDSLQNNNNVSNNSSKANNLRPSQPTWATSPPVGCYSLHPPSPFIVITQPESWYSFYRPTKGRRLSCRPRHQWRCAAHAKGCIYSDCC